MNKLANTFIYINEFEIFISLKFLIKNEPTKILKV